MAELVTRAASRRPTLNGREVWPPHATLLFSSDVDEEFMHFSGAEFCECVHAVSLIFESLFQTLFRVVQQN